jgi:hypothetical protein
MSELVTVASYTSVTEAQLAKTRLEAEGIPSFLQNDDFTGVGLGDVRVRVTADLAQRAHDVLAPPRGGAAAASEPDRAEEPERCLICQAGFVERPDASLAIRLLRAIVLQVVPIPEEWLVSKARRCGVCGHRWKAGATGPTPIA